MLQINTMQQFQGYLTGVESCIDHHAGKVRSTTVIIAGIVAAHATPGSVQVRTVGEKSVNVIWFKAAGGDFCLSYNHDSEDIEIRRGRRTAGKRLLGINDDNFADDVHGWIQVLVTLFTTGVNNA